MRLLKANEIECRVGIINAKGLTLLLYKDARVDMKILDEEYGVGNWQRNHKELKGNIYCGIGIWNKEIKQWIWKWDCGSESYTEKEKGESSDSFKRAGFNVGIGRELYTSPFIWIRPNKDEFEKNETTGKYSTKTTFKVTEIGYDNENAINKLTIEDNKGNIRFQIMPSDESKERITLMSEVNELVAIKEFDFEKFVEYFKTDNTALMTISQLKEAKAMLKRKKDNV